MDQRVEEVDSQADPNDQPDDGLDHLLSSSQSVASNRVDAHQDEEQNPDHQVDDVGHGANLQCDDGFLPRTVQAINMARSPSP